LSLITAFVNTHQGILNLTTDDNVFTVFVYVAYRRPFPDEETVNLVKNELKKNNIEYSHLTDWPMKHCKYEESSTEEGSSV
jgi:hypothetical protein